MAQAVEFTASAKSSVQVGEQFRLIYTVNEQVDRFEGPDFEGFNMLSGPNQSTSQSYQFINGKVSQSFQVTYTYYLQASKEGTFNINPAKIISEGKTYESNSLTINVSQSYIPPRQLRRRETSDQLNSQDRKALIKMIFLSKHRSTNRSLSRVNRSSSPIKYTQPFRSRRSISVRFLHSPDSGIKACLNDNDPLKQSNEVVNGKEYVVADLRKIALYAQRSGEIKIEPMELQCVAQVKAENSRTRDPFFDSFFNDPFFNRNYQNVELKVESNPLTIDVKPLPATGKPLDFSGAVGSFNITSDIDRTEIKIK